jgi:biopolymer transport protein ExbD
MQFKTKPKRKVLINITSLIDVMFLLLLFFMVTSTFLEQPGIKLELPYAQSAAAVDQKDYVLFVNKESRMYLNDSQVGLEELEARIKASLPKMKDQALVLKADQDVTHGMVVKLMDIAKRSGVRKLVIGTKMEK